LLVSDKIGDDPTEPRARNPAPTAALPIDDCSGHAGVLAASHQEEHVDRGDLATAVGSEQKPLVWVVTARTMCGAVTEGGVRA
jgi:hypothetical protein